MALGFCLEGDSAGVLVGELLILIMSKIYTEYVLCRASKRHLTDLNKGLQAYPLRNPAIIWVLECHRIHYQCVAFVGIHLSHRWL
jgi:hypothetical protein